MPEPMQEGFRESEQHRLPGGEQPGMCEACEDVSMAKVEGRQGDSWEAGSRGLTWGL